jgi:hypothetical protein
VKTGVFATADSKEDIVVIKIIAELQQESQAKRSPANIIINWTIQGK